MFKKLPFSKDTKINIAIITIASLISIVSFIYYFKMGYILIYADAFAHLNIAREVFDSLTPGLVQLGTVWLPLPHIIMLPFIWNNFLWHSGIAGSIGSMVSYVITVFFMYKTVKLLTKSYKAGIVAAAIVGLNPNYIYMQVTPMTESLALATITLFLYYLLKWSKTYKISDLIITAVFAFLATLTRYEAWFLAAYGTVYIFLMSYKKKSYIRAESLTLLYSSVAFFGIFLWIIYNFLIIGNPFNFLLGSNSANAQQEAIFKAGALPTKHNLPLTLSVYTWDLIDVVGIFVLGAAIISIIAYIFKEKDKKSLIYLLVAFGPPSVIILTLYLGITVIAVPQIAIQKAYGQMFNIRYGLMSLPFIALAASLIAAKSKYITAGLFLVILIQAILFYKTNDVLTLNDSLKGQSAFHLDKTTLNVAHVLYNSCRNNETLIYTAIQTNHQILLESNIDIKNFIYEGNYRYWQNALQNPTLYATCIVMGTHDDKSDPVRTALYHNPNLTKNYKVIFKDDTDLVYKKI